ncbi:hypothetical protein AaE_016019, partial [Aphanomyces astaci]
MGLGAAHCPQERPARLAQDHRQPAHQRVYEAYAIAYAELDAAQTVLVGARAFFTLDWFKGYWQLTPTRVLMGQTDAVPFCQSAMDFMFADLLFKGLLAWLDDMLGYAETPEDLLDQVLTICSSFGLKLNPKKCDLFLTKAV